MASSQVEIASSSPIGCVLQDHNRGDRCRETNARAAVFEKNLRELVRDHFQNCISISADENSSNQVGKIDSWAANEQGNDSWAANEQGNNHPHQRHHRHRNLRFLSNNHSRNNKNKRSNDDSAIVCSKQSRHLDRWAAKQAREIVSTLEKESQEAELLASSSGTASSLNGQRSENSPNIGNPGASSLVQMWEARLSRSNSMKMNQNLDSISSTTSSGSSNIGNVENASRVIDEPLQELEIGDPVNDVGSNNEDSSADWEPQSDRAAQSELPTLGVPDAGESERVRVADIIRKLIRGGDENDSEMVPSASELPPRERRSSPVTDQAEQRELRGFPLVVNSPKIRGRQAFADLLMQMERDRHKELESLAQRHAVSRFTHRGRIQSMLRLKFLKRGMAIQDQQRPKSNGSSVNRLSKGSSIMHLREKFSSGAEHRVTAQSDASTSGSSHTEVESNMEHSNNSTFTSRLGENSHNQEAATVGRQSTSMIEHSGAQTSHQDHHKESSPRSVVGTVFLDSQQTAEATEVLNGRHRSETAEDQEANRRQHIHLNSQEHLEGTASLDVQNEITDEQETNDEQQHYLDSQETAEITAFLNDWDENQPAEEDDESYDQGNYGQSNFDWISEISRPRSYWENRRQAWYQEILNSSSNNDEIRQLLERRRVSSFLTSDFRETMDQLMTFRVERQIELEGYADEEQEQEEFNRERIGQLLLSHLQRHLHLQSAVTQEEEQAEEGDEVEQVDEEEEEQAEEGDEVEQVDGEEEEQGEVEEEDEDRQSPISDQDHDHESSDYFDQSSLTIQTTSSTTPSWSYQGQEVGDDSDPVESESSRQNLPSQAYYQDSQLSSSANRLSIEMELIYDLRGQLEQLHREMCELRKSVNSCMDMQVKLKHSPPQEVQSAQGMGNNAVDGAPKKSSCCICYEMKIDSLLYRCGHMCTCLKCALELQWSSGKCPICRAPIEDVVRAYMDS